MSDTLVCMLALSRREYKRYRHLINIAGYDGEELSKRLISHALYFDDLKNVLDYMPRLQSARTHNIEVHIDLLDDQWIDAYIQKRVSLGLYVDKELLIKRIMYYQLRHCNHVLMSPAMARQVISDMFD